jgi:hypothetical protein
MDITRRKKVLCPMEKNGKTFWLRIGSAFTNADGSLNVYLDAYPTNCKLQIRELDDKDLQARSSRENGRSNGDGDGEVESEQLPF